MLNESLVIWALRCWKQQQQRLHLTPNQLIKAVEKGSSEEVALMADKNYVPKILSSYISVSK